MSIAAMRLLPGLLVVPLLTMAAAGCSHGTLKEVPTAPTPAAGPVTLNRLTITPVGGGIMIEGAATPITSSGGFPSTGATLGAFAEYSDGSGKYVEAAWTSSNTSVIVIENGAFTAKGRGVADITATVDGKSDSETFVVHGGIPGTWSGTLLVEQCGAGSGSMQELICHPPNQGRTPGVLAVGSTAPITMQITRSGADLSATVQFGDLRGTLTGSDRGQNFFSLLGELSSNTTTARFVVWNTRVTEDVMEGTIGFEVRSRNLPGHAEVVAKVDRITRR